MYCVSRYLVCWCSCIMYICILVLAVCFILPYYASYKPAYPVYHCIILYFIYCVLHCALSMSYSISVILIALPLILLCDIVYVLCFLCAAIASITYLVIAMIIIWLHLPCMWDYSGAIWCTLGLAGARAFVICVSALVCSSHALLSFLSIYVACSS